MGIVLGYISLLCFILLSAKICTRKLQGTDGSYIGEYDAGYIYTKVEVIISNGTTEDIILLKHENERGQAAERVLSDIVDTQMFPVDAITGATNSSKVIQKAILNALEEAEKKQ